MKDTKQVHLLVLSTTLKILIFPAYKSTDFEVHRNWLAITHSLPLKQWYYDTTSPWTLDYPPFFAYFEWILSHFAYLFDPEIVRLDNLDYSSWSVVVFQRSTVIISELVLSAALMRWVNMTKIDKKVAFLIAAAAFLHPGLVIVDHIHFQYNGMLLGMLLWSLLFIQYGHTVLGAMTFASLLLFKHLYIFVAPPIFTYLLRTYCFTSTPKPKLPPSETAKDDVLSPKTPPIAMFTTSPTITSFPSISPSSSTTTFAPQSSTPQPVPLPKPSDDDCEDDYGLTFNPAHFLTLGLSVLLPTVLAFGPFLLSTDDPLGMLMQIKERLFPFQRGVNHAYWAGNWWAIYTIVDRILIRYLKFKGLDVDENVLGSATKGLVQDTVFGVLPTPTPALCMGIILALNAVYSHKLWTNPSGKNLVKHVCLSAMTSFMFGWHVHEKAALHFLIPMSLVAVDDVDHLRTFAVTTFSGVYGLFPLLINAAETPIKILCSTIWAQVVLTGLRRVVYRGIPTTFDIITLNLEYVYLASFLLLQLYISVFHSMVFPTTTEFIPHTTCVNVSTVSIDTEGAFEGMGLEKTMEERCETFWTSEKIEPMKFLPLLLTSAYCAVGIGWSWVRFSYLFMKGK